MALLDERVTQLERSALGSGFTAGTFSEPASAGGAAVGGKTATKSADAPTSATAASLKPTTREIQQALQNAGFYQGSVDGKMGPVTREAIKEFQRVHGLVDDGVAGTRTWVKLKAYADLSAGSEELNAAEVLK
jgi:peptidoglycan hydrolase-like protein with peptidoglycan-binding domain